MCLEDSKVGCKSSPGETRSVSMHHDDLCTHFVTLKTLRRRRARSPERPKEPARGMKFTQNTFRTFVFVFLDFKRNCMKANCD